MWRGSIVFLFGLLLFFVMVIGAVWVVRAIPMGKVLVMQHMPNLPTGVNLSVPDLSQLGPRPAIDFSHIKVSPGDSVMVVLPRTANANDVEQVKRLFMQWEPRVNWLIVSGVEQVTQIVPNPDPTDAKAPQGPDDVGYMGWMEADKHGDSDCPGPPECM